MSNSCKEYAVSLSWCRFCTWKLIFYR